MRDYTIMDHRLIAAAIKDRACYSVLQQLQIDQDLGPQSAIAWRALEDYYTRDTHVSCADTAIIKERCIRAHEKHAEIFSNYFDAIQTEQVSPANVLADALEVKKKSLGLRLSAQIVNGHSPRDLLDEYQRLCNITPEQLIETGESGGRVYHLYSADECIRDMDDIIKLSPKGINKLLGGGLYRGNHVVVFARPEGAKSLFAINLAYGFCQQKLKTLYVGNEDSRQNMGERFLARFTGMTRDDLSQLPADDIMGIATDHGYEHLYFAPMSPGTPSEIREIMREYGPFDCLLVDQIRNLDVGGDNKVLQLEKAATEIRYIAKQLNVLAISITQAGGSAENKLMLDMGDVDFSNTGIPSTADVMIGIGSTEEYRKSNQRMLSFCKNKTPGNSHGNALIIKLNPTISKVEEPNELD